jgi:hypothetical protein
VLRGKLKEHFLHEISVEIEWHPRHANLLKIYSLCTTSEITKYVVYQNIKANPIKEETWDLINREISQEADYKESSR